MPERGVEVQGLREFRRELRAAGQQFPRELRQANLEAAELVAADARRRAPRGPHLGGGRVRPIIASIRALASQGRGQIAVGGATSPHGPVLEFGGTIPRFHSQARTPVRAQPFLYPAIAAKGEEIVEFYGEALEQVYARAFPRGF